MNSQLIDAVRNNNLLIVRELIANGADVNCRNECDYTPLYYAKSLDIVQLLVANGANVNYQNICCTTPLHYVKSVEIAQFFVLNGANINSKMRLEKHHYIILIHSI